MDPPKHLDTAAVFSDLLAALGLSSGQLAREIGTSQQVIHNYVSGRNKPGHEVLAALLNRYPALNPAWLLTGKGEPFPAGQFNQRPTTPPTTPTAAALRVNREGESESYWQAVAAERAARIEEMSRALELAREDLSAWRDAYRKPQASADAATAYPYPQRLQVEGLVRYDAPARSARATTGKQIYLLTGGGNGAGAGRGVGLVRR